MINSKEGEENSSVVSTAIKINFEGGIVCRMLVLTV